MNQTAIDIGGVISLGCPKCGNRDATEFRVWPPINCEIDFDGAGNPIGFAPVEGAFDFGIIDCDWDKTPAYCQLCDYDGHLADFDRAEQHTVSYEVNGQLLAGLAAALVVRSIWFEVTPLHDDIYSVRVKPNGAPLVRDLLANGPGA